jgi:hypothetical protein
MAAKMFKYGCTVAHDANDRTAAQFLVAANNRVVCHGIRFMPLGSTGASTPLIWQLGTQDAAGSGSADNGNLKKVPPGYDESIVTTVLGSFDDTGDGEPTLTPYWTITLHMQSTILWTPPLPAGKQLIWSAAERWGLVYSVGQSSLSVGYEFILEE